MAIAFQVRRIPLDRTRTARRLLVDRWAARVVTGGGLVIIASILAIVGVIALEIVPLFRPARAGRVGEPIAVGSPVLLAAVDEYRDAMYAVTPAGRIEIRGLSGHGAVTHDVAGLNGAGVTTAAVAGGGRHLLGTSDGRVISLEMKFDVTFEDGRRRIVPSPQFAEPVAVDPDGRRAVTRVAGAFPDGGPVIVAEVSPPRLVLVAVVQRKALIGPGTKEETRQDLPLSDDGAINALALDGRGDDLFVGTTRGRIVRYDLRDRANPVRVEAVDATTAGSAVTVLGFLNGDRTLVVGDAAGGVSTWQLLPGPGGGAPRLTRLNDFEPHAAAITAMSPSRRDKGFVTSDTAGVVRLHYGTTGQTLLTLPGHAGSVRAVTFAPKADGVVAVDATGRATHWDVDNPHPEVTMKALFAKVWYEGYGEPTYVWQSTGGTDDFEAKLSLTPLVFGTLKGTLYALLFAVPIALLAALYVSEFMHPSLRATVKPAVEIMAALPSVVLGFLAGLWLAPVIEAVLPGLVLFGPVFALGILVTLFLWRRVPAARRLRPGVEALALVPVAAIAGWFAFTLGGILEAWLLGGDYRGWLGSALGLGFDQRNSVVVGIAMGFAVIPIIFTIAEDSLTNVPQHLRAGSLALGATRWQTAVRIVLPTASPGIFSAIMIGFGRAVGETMIVLMATGNTPVMDWNIFSGFRALSANIAVELPEAPEQGTLFRVLFLAAFLLFCFTFTVNTVAELVRLRLRRRYQGL
ncbi:MAG: ABC transporter permease subunit [Candidatus Rokubacteria bacterium]|nr:ABC transporter permease subunit [Candidatus Rokubacteria bacterium]